ncbi:hypothetical protein RhiirB3_458192 [Rhizophagus irregularis]|nr:hypothetical protein RhiirB3_458192 [Rhizophagus irregularis]
MDETKAINNNNFYGPSFGLDLKLQLLFSDGKISCDKNHYEKPIKVNNDDSFILDFFEFRSNII